MAEPNDDWYERMRAILLGPVGDFDRYHPEVTRTTTMPRQIPTESDIPMDGWRPYSDIHLERIRAHNKHCAGPHGSMEQKPWDHPIWLAVLTEEVGEVARALCENELGNVRPTVHLAHLREELVQVAAMAAAWIDAIDGAPR